MVAMTRMPPVFGLILAGAFFTGFHPLRAADRLCRNEERCFGLGVSSSAKPDLQYAVGTWPLPRRAKMRAVVGEQLHFEWDSRNEYYAEGEKNWVKRATGLRISWEDPCGGGAPGPWPAQSSDGAASGSFDEVLKDCATGHTIRFKIHSDAIKPKPPEAELEITVAKSGEPAPSPSPKR
jgi:hypothetical protein